MFICAASHTKLKHFVLEFIVVVCRCSATFSFTNLQSFCNVVFRLSLWRQCSRLDLQPLLLMQTVHCAFKDCTWTQICFLMQLYFCVFVFAQNKVNAVARFIFYGLCGCLLFFFLVFFYNESGMGIFLISYRHFEHVWCFLLIHILTIVVGVLCSLVI